MEVFLPSVVCPHTVSMGWNVKLKRRGQSCRGGTGFAAGGQVRAALATGFSHLCCPFLLKEEEKKKAKTGIHP